MNPLTGVLAEAWGLYRRFAAHFLTIAFVLYFLTAVIVTILVQTAGVTGYFVASVIEFAATFQVQAAMIKAVQDVRDGRTDLSMDATVSAAVRYLLPVIGASILAGIGIVISRFPHRWPCRSTNAVIPCSSSSTKPSTCPR